MKIIAHRGASATHPENTLAAFRAAWACGADGVELDVHASADGVAVVIHDASLLRTAGIDRPVAAMTAAELGALDVGHGEPVPALESVLAESPPGRLVFVEIKGGLPAVDAVARIPMTPWIRFLSFDPDLAIRLRERCPGIPVLLNAEVSDVEVVLDILGRAGLDGLNGRWTGETDPGLSGEQTSPHPRCCDASSRLTETVRPTLLSHGYGRARRPRRAAEDERTMSEGAGGWIARCRDAGVPVWLWGDIPLADAEPLQRLGVEGIMVDDPSAFRKTLSR